MLKSLIAKGLLRCGGVRDEKRVGLFFSNSVKQSLGARFGVKKKLRCRKPILGNRFAAFLCGLVVSMFAACGHCVHWAFCDELRTSRCL